MNDKLYQLVKEAYENAIDNGYNLEYMTSQEVAEDMHSLDADIEEYPIEEVEICVNLYRMDNK